MVTHKMRKIEKTLLKTLKMVYIGEGLFVRIDEVTIPMCFGDERDIDTYTISGVYGRVDSSTDNPNPNNFHKDFSLTIDSDFSAEFIKGMFYSLIMADCD